MLSCLCFGLRVARLLVCFIFVVVVVALCVYLLLFFNCLCDVLFVNIICSVCVCVFALLFVLNSVWLISKAIVE